MENIALIPARGGSKRIPKKNIKLFHGKPIIAYSIEAAINSGCFDKIIVSTDNDEIAEIALQFGAEIPFIRPANLSTDEVLTIDVTKHAIRWCLENNINVNLICCIYPTAPLISGDKIHSAFVKLTAAPDKDYAFPVCLYPHPIQRALRIGGSQSNTISMFFPNAELERTQDLELTYHDAGQFYWGRANAFLREEKVLSSSRSIPIIVPKSSAIDIDEPEDWEFAEKIFSTLKD